MVADLFKAMAEPTRLHLWSVAVGVPPAGSGESAQAATPAAATVSAEARDVLRLMWSEAAGRAWTGYVLHMTSRSPGRIWRILTILAGLFLTAFGAFVVAAGQADDSPGLGGLGLITVGIGLVMLVRAIRPARGNPPASR